MNEIVDYKFEGKRLRITRLSEIKTIDFDFPIRQVVEYNNLALVRLEPDIGTIYNENVFCVSSEGNVIWQVAPVKHIDEDSPYTNIVIKNGQLFLYSWSGEKMEVDLDNGKIINKTFAK